MAKVYRIEKPHYKMGKNVGRKTEEGGLDGCLVAWLINW